MVVVAWVVEGKKYGLLNQPHLQAPQCYRDTSPPLSLHLTSRSSDKNDPVFFRPLSSPRVVDRVEGKADMIDSARTARGQTLIRPAAAVDIRQMFLSFLFVFFFLHLRKVTTSPIQRVLCMLGTCLYFYVHNARCPPELDMECVTRGA